MNLMKIARCFLGMFGLSTFHLHNNPPLGSSSLSKVEPPIESKNIFTIAAAKPVKQQRQNKEIEFKVISIERKDYLPAPIILEKTKRTWTRPPRTIAATKKPKHPQSKHNPR